MDNLADDSRTNQGLVFTRDRYIRRAESLLDDEWFKDLIHHVRTAWGTKYPRYVLRTADDIQGYYPARLMRDLKELAHTDNGRMNEPVQAWLDWGKSTDVLCAEFFPPDDFSTSASKLSSHPALWFICAALGANKVDDLRPRLNDLFPSSDFELRLEPAAERREILWAIQCPHLHDDVLSSGYVMPIWPDLRAHDHEKHAAAISNQAKELLHGRSVTSRIAALKSQGVSLKRIATKLGLSPSTMKSQGRRQNKRSSQ